MVSAGKRDETIRRCRQGKRAPGDECAWYLALGDVNGGPPSLHISYNDFQMWTRPYAREKAHDCESPFPYSVFTDPQLGGVGMTEKEPGKSQVRSGKFDVHVSAIEPMRRPPHEIIVDRANDKILERQSCERTRELIHVLYTYAWRIAAYTLLKTVYIHPTCEDFLAHETSTVN